jgi:hypothetical protein
LHSISPLLHIEPLIQPRHHFEKRVCSDNETDRRDAHEESEEPIILDGDHRIAPAVQQDRYSEHGRDKEEEDEDEVEEIEGSGATFNKLVNGC